MIIKEFKLGYSNKIEGFENVYALNGFEQETEITNISLYRHYQLSRFKEMIENNKLAVVSPVLWQDKYEKRFLFTDYSTLNFKQKVIRCLCLTTDSNWNEDAGWKRYTSEEEKETVRLCFNGQKLLKVLDDYAAKNNATIYIGECIYGLGVDCIKTLHKSDNLYHNFFFPSNFKVENYLTLMLLKRKAFVYEGEVRIFIYYNDRKVTSSEKSKLSKNDDTTDTDSFDKIDVDYKSILKEIRLSPYIVEERQKDIKKEFSNLDIKTTTSQLYETGWQLKKV